MAGIETIHWDELPATLAARWMAAAGRLFALWPAPLDHDACLRDAGFDEFADTDDRWHRELAEIVGSLLASLGSRGAAQKRSGEYPIKTPGQLGGPRPQEHDPRANRLEEAVLAAALDDNFEPCVLEFGSPPVGALRTSDGHAIFWVWLAGAAPGFDQLLRAAARGRPVCRTTLDWAKLA